MSDGGSQPDAVVPVLTSYNIARVLKLKQRLQQQCAPMIGQRLDGRAFAEFRELLRLGFPYRGRNIDEDVLRKSTQGLANSTLSRALLAETAWRLAGNLAHLRNCCAVPPWSGQQRPEWAPVQIVSGNLHWNRRRKKGGMFRFRFLAGSPCPLWVAKFWSNGLCSVLGRDLGFSAPWGNRPYADPRQLVGMRAYVLLLPELCGNTPGFRDVRVPSGCKTWNTNLLTMRYRLRPEEFRCPYGYPDEHPCHSCPVGEDKCDAAVHSETFKQKYCGRCKRDEAWFDPASTRRICVDCTHALQWKGEL